MEFKTKIIVSVLLFLFSNNISLLKAPINKSEKVCLKNDTNIVNNKLKLNKYMNEEILILKQRFKLPVNIKNRNQILKYNGFKSYEETRTITFGKAGKLNKLAKTDINLSLIHISEPTRPRLISYAVFCLKKKKISSNKN